MILWPAQRQIVQFNNFILITKKEIFHFEKTIYFVLVHGSLFLRQDLPPKRLVNLASMFIQPRAASCCSECTASGRQGRHAGLNIGSVAAELSRRARKERKGGKRKKKTGEEQENWDERKKRTEEILNRVKK